jgi:hypothetical protein
MKRSGLALSVAVTLPALLLSGACGTEEWAFNDRAASTASEASIDADVMDDDTQNAQDAPRESAAADSGCDPETSRCAVSCAGGAPCPADMPICTEPYDTCEPCRSNQDCQYVRSGPICAQSGACVAECTSDRQCNYSRPYCDRPIGRCVRCVYDNDCPTGDVCVMHQCVPGGRDP